MTVRRWPALLVAVPLAGCTLPVAPRPATALPVLLIPAPAPVPPPVRKPVDTATHCPTVADIRRLRAARPQPLRAQAMPASPAERVARTAAQLGLYEARGAWADQVDDALERCAAD